MPTWQRGLRILSHEREYDGARLERTNRPTRIAPPRHKLSIAEREGVREFDARRVHRVRFHSLNVRETSVHVKIYFRAPLRFLVFVGRHRASHEALLFLPQRLRDKKAPRSRHLAL